MSDAAARHSSLTLGWIAYSEPPALIGCCDDDGISVEIGTGPPANAVVA